MTFHPLQMQFENLLFADNTSIIISGVDKNCLVKLADDIFTWFIANKLTLNFDKQTL
jgi:hypothetical protein